MSTVVIIGQHYWGKAPDVARAKAQFTREGGRLSNGYLVVTFDDESEFFGVDDWGRYSYKGNPPTEKLVKPRGEGKRS